MVSDRRAQGTGLGGLTFAVHVMLSCDIITALGGPVVPAERGMDGREEQLFEWEWNTMVKRVIN